MIFMLDSYRSGSEDQSQPLLTRYLGYMSTADSLGWVMYMIVCIPLLTLETKLVLAVDQTSSH